MCKILYRILNKASDTIRDFRPNCNTMLQLDTCFKKKKAGKGIHSELIDVCRSSASSSTPIKLSLASTKRNRTSLEYDNGSAHPVVLPINIYEIKCGVLYIIIGIFRWKKLQRRGIFHLVAFQ